MTAASAGEAAGEVRIAFITAPDRGTAAGIARALVEERLAACVNLVPGVRSIYRWEGALQEQEETLLLVKTTAGRARALEARVRELHPYDVPELVCVTVAAGSEPYLAWVARETSP